jgi:hypothetical protein
MTEHETKALMSNFGLMIFHTLGDRESADFASSLLGHHREVFVSYSPKADLTMGEEIFGDTGGSCSVSETYQPVLQSRAFLSGLRSGGAEGMVDGIVIRAGVPFKWGQNWIKVAFSQK